MDFVLEKQNGQLVGIELKTSNRIEQKDFKGLQELQKLIQDDFICGIVLYRGKEVVFLVKTYGLFLFQIYGDRPVFKPLAPQPSLMTRPIGNYTRPASRRHPVPRLQNTNQLQHSLAWFLRK